MARILVSEPVAETRELLERLLTRLGHVVVAWPGDGVDEVDAVVFEPSHREGVALARRLREQRPETALVACSALGDQQDGLPTLMQPFQPADLARALETALGRRARTA